MQRNIRKLREQYAKVLHDKRQMNDDAEEAGRNFSKDEREKYNRLCEAQKDLKDRIERAESLEEEMEELGESGGRSSDPEPEPERHAQDRQQSAEAFLEEFELDFEPDLRDTAEYHSRFERAAVSGLNVLRHDEIQDLIPSSSELSNEMRGAMTSASARNHMQADNDTGGGWMVASTRFAAQIYRRADEQLWAMNLATVENVRVAEELGQLFLESDFDDYRWTAELEEPDPDELAFGRRILHPWTVKKEVLLSIKLLAARGGRRVLQVVNQRLGYKANSTFEYSIFNGDGNKKFLGLMVPSVDGIPTSRDVPQTGLQIHPDTLKRMKNRVPMSWRNRRTFTWGFHPDITLELDLLKDDQGRYIWKDGIEEGHPSRLLSVPVRESRFLPHLIVPGGYFGYCGDMSWYHIARVMGANILRHDTYIRRNLRGWIAILEADGYPALDEAFARGQFAL